MADESNGEDEEVPPLPPPIMPPAIPPVIPSSFSSTATSIYQSPISTNTYNTISSSQPLSHTPAAQSPRTTIPHSQPPPVTQLPRTYNAIPRFLPPPVTPLPCTTTHNTVPCCSQPLSYTPAAQLPIITTAHHTITRYSQQLDYTPMAHCLPPVSSNYYPLGYSQPPSWLPSPMPPLCDDTTMANNHDSYIMHELELLKERMARLEEKLVSTNNGDVMSNDTGIPELNSEQMMVIGMISTNPSIGWKVALRKLLMVVFGEETLAGSCCKGRKNATFQPLDGTKLHAVKGTLQNFNKTIYLYFYFTHVAFIYRKYGPSQELREETMNIIVNSCCSLARRSLKNKSI